MFTHLKKKKKGDVTILCDTPYVRDVSALFGHENKANRFHSTHGLAHVETLDLRQRSWLFCSWQTLFASTKPSFDPPELKRKTLHNPLNFKGDTAVHTDRGTRSRYTKCGLSWKRLGGSVNCFAIMVLSSNCYWSRMICICLTELVLRYQFEYNYISKTAVLHPRGGEGGGGVHGISSDGDDRRIFWGLKFLIPGCSWVRKFDKYFFG